ncbi:hypothetical protein [Roseococcus thiosulfatophilus]|uniref:hypothetical protein n=1 Tax=Roseococcus thiosulfatophilus TaxID=35813 RepID=UPI001A8D913E|nr:hypothetical protein [Roseococcus thiosulfatophilus]
MVNDDITGQATDTATKNTSPVPRRLSSARVDEEVQGGEFWVLMRSVGIVVGLVLLVGWIIG